MVTLRSLIATKLGNVLNPIDRSVSHKDLPRLRGQSARIVQRLRRGPATNAELATISLKYTSRLSDIRAAGYVVDAERGEGGIWTYTLRD